MQGSQNIIHKGQIKNIHSRTDSEIHGKKISSIQENVVTTLVQ